MQFAEAEGEEGMPIVTLPEVLCATPRFSKINFHVIYNCIKWALRNQSVSNVSVLPRKKLRLQDPVEDNYTNVSTSTQRWAPYVFCIAHKSADSSRTDSLPIFGA